MNCHNFKVEFYEEDANFQVEFGDDGSEFQTSFNDSISINLNHNHDDRYDPLGAADTAAQKALTEAKNHTNEQINLVTEYIDRQTKVIKTYTDESIAELRNYTDEEIDNTKKEIIADAPNKHNTLEKLGDLIEANERQIQELKENVAYDQEVSKTYETKSNVEQKINETKRYVDDALDSLEIPEVDLSNYYNKQEINAALKNKADREEIPSLDEYATKKYVDEAIDGINIPEVDLSEYYKKDEVDEALREKASQNALDDLTESVDQLEEAFKNIDSFDTQADWNQNDETARDYVKNRTHWVEDEGNNISETRQITEKPDGLTVKLDDPEFADLLLRYRETAKYYVSYYDQDEIEYFYDHSSYDEEGKYWRIDTNNPQGHTTTIQIIDGTVWCEDYVVDHSLTSVTISIVCNNEIIHHLDPKFIKDMYGEIEEILFEQEITLDDESYFGFPENLPLVDGQKLTVTVNGVSYTETVQQDDIDLTWLNNNLGIVYDYGLDFRSYNDYNGMPNETIKIKIVSIIGIKTIDPKYLPEELFDTFDELQGEIDGLYDSSEKLIANISGNLMKGFTCDVPFANLLAALENGKRVEFCVNTYQYITPSYWSSSKIVIVDIELTNYTYYTLKSDNTVTLTLKGLVTRSDLLQETGTVTANAMSQKAVTDALALKADITYVEDALEGVSGFVAQADEPEDTSVLWLDIDDNTDESESGSGADLSNYYNKSEIDAIMGSYINDIDTLLGGDA